MEKVTKQLDLKAEKLRVISQLLKKIDLDNEKELTSQMLKKLQGDIKQLIITDF